MTTPILAEQLTACDREPINKPGAIQDHGVLVAIRESDMCIQEISANAREVFGRAARTLLGKPITPLLDAKEAERLSRHVARGIWNSLQPITLAITRRHGKKMVTQRWDSFVHRQGDALILELERAAPVEKSTPYYRQLRATLGRVHAAHSLLELCQRAAKAVRQITHYDLVMVYRFDGEWNGEVIAQSKDKNLPNYLHHHFPASDIPKQAREAFRSTWVRTIPDVSYKPVPVLQEEGREPLDMSKSLLRSVSPIHIQYLKNMGTGATLTISLLHDGKLWGLIACHHLKPSLLFHEARLACELVGKAVSSLLESRQLHDEEASEKDLLEKRALLARSIETSPSVRDGLWSHPEALLAVVGATGAAVRIDADKTWMLLGKTPSRKQMAPLANWLDGHMNDQAVFTTAHLANDYPRAKDLRETACGLLAITIPKAERNFIMWFRPEAVHTKVWAGEPNKQVTRLPDGTLKIEPRQSFDDWQEAITLRAQPWTRVEVASALHVRNDVMALDLRKQFDLAQKAIRVREEFLSIASHELKTPLTTMRLQTEMTQRRIGRPNSALEVPRLQQALKRINEGIDRLVRLVDDMLDISRIATGKLAIRCGEVELISLVSDVIDRMRSQFEAAHVPLHIELGAPAHGHWDGLRIEQVLWNLLSNALRYGRGSPVTVRAGVEAGEATFQVHDEGPGIAPEHQGRIFDKFERADTQQEAFGLGLGLHICRSIVELHQGRIWLQSRPQAGTTFCVSLPLKLTV